MAWYYGTFACGCKGRVNVTGPHKDREWKIENKFSGFCPDCYEKNRIKEIEKENEKSKKEAEEMELPELTGSEKQIAWAITLRQKFIRKIYDSIRIKSNERRNEGQSEDEIKKYILEENEILDFGLSVKTEARFWIDYRNEFPRIIFHNFRKLYDEEKRRLENEIPADIKKEIDEEEQRLTVVPESNTKNGVVKIEYNSNSKYLKVRYPKDDRFREIVKSFGFSWKGVWQKKITEYTGTAVERSAELGNKLLKSGFVVQFFCEEAKELAVNGTFEPEIKNWLKWDEDEKKLYLRWDGYNDKIYYAAKRLPSAKYKSGVIYLSTEFYKEILDFVEIMNFRLSQAANEEIERYIEKEKNFEIIGVLGDASKKELPEEKLYKKLKKTGVIEDLRDDDET